MVEFCASCGTSLPRGDLLFRGGKSLTPHDYACPHCGKIANPGKEPQEIFHEPGTEHDLIIRGGRTQKEA